MKFLTYRQNSTYKLGLKTDMGIVDVAGASVALDIDLPITPNALYAAGTNALAGFQALSDANIDMQYILDESALHYGPIVPNPGKILCVGLNYRKHAAESGMAEPKTPVLFSKFNNTVAAPDEDVPITAEMTQVDYESELLVVIGKTAKNVSEDEALDYVLGYANANDLSERALQMLTGQWLLGKTLDKFMPIGPYLVTSDEIPDPQTLAIKGWINGELRQNSHTGDMIFSVKEIIAYASRFMTLYPGDIISTGTPEGVILGMNPKVWMQPGDEYVVEIEKLGRLSNRMVEG